MPSASLYLPQANDLPGRFSRVVRGGFVVPTQVGLLALLSVPVSTYRRRQEQSQTPTRAVIEPAPPDGTVERQEGSAEDLRKSTFSCSSQELVYLFETILGY